MKFSLKNFYPTIIFLYKMTIRFFRFRLKCPTGVGFLLLQMMLQYLLNIAMIYPSH